MRTEQESGLPEDADEIVESKLENDSETIGRDGLVENPSRKLYEATRRFSDLAGTREIDPHYLTKVIGDMIDTVDESLTPQDVAADNLEAMINYVSTLSENVDYVYETFDKESQEAIWAERHKLIGKLNDIRMALERRLSGREWRSNPDPKAN